MVPARPVRVDRFVGQLRGQFPGVQRHEGGTVDLNQPLVRDAAPLDLGQREEVVGVLQKGVAQLAEARARSSGGPSAQGPSSKARRAAPIAASTSSTSASGAWAIVSSVDGDDVVVAADFAARSTDRRCTASTYRRVEAGRPCRLLTEFSGSTHGVHLSDRYRQSLALNKVVNQGNQQLLTATTMRRVDTVQIQHILTISVRSARCRGRPGCPPTVPPALSRTSSSATRTRRTRNCARPRRSCGTTSRSSGRCSSTRTSGTYRPTRTCSPRPRASRSQTRRCRIRCRRATSSSPIRRGTDSCASSSTPGSPVGRYVPGAQGARDRLRDSRRR